ncbi:MAG: response regulator [Oscillospiraceae bacterium]|jgi:putative two-component system response regulator|nr:response regulator [Oscillospiraceae bacterium]
MDSKLTPNKKKKMLIVDDVEINRIILRDLHEDNYEVLEAENGKVAIDLLEQYGDKISIVLLDLVMPVMDGFEVLVYMNSNSLIQRVPVIVVSGENDEKKSLVSYELGASDLISKPFNADIVVRRVTNVVDLYAYKKGLEHRIENQVKILERQAERLKQSNQFVIDALSTAVEFRDCESGQHIKRIRLLTKIILEAAREYYPLTNEQIEFIVSASAMHDIGKIAIPDVILLKPGRLTAEEFEIMKTHTTRGCELLKTLDYPQGDEYFKYCYDVCRHHHERWDGKGYPDGLVGDENAVWAQATAIADVYDALVSERVYKSAYSHDDAVRMIVNGECGQFNPVLLKCLLKVKDDIYKMTQEHK